MLFFFFLAEVNIGLSKVQDWVFLSLRRNSVPQVQVKHPTVLHTPAGLQLAASLHFKLADSLPASVLYHLWCKIQNSSTHSLRMFGVMIICLTWLSSFPSHGARKKKRMACVTHRACKRSVAFIHTQFQKVFFCHTYWGFLLNTIWNTVYLF